MCLIHIGVKKQCFIGCNQRNIIFIGQINKFVFRLAFAVQSDTGYFHIKAIAEYFFELQSCFFGLFVTSLQKQPSDLAFHPGT